MADPTLLTRTIETLEALWDCTCVPCTCEGAPCETDKCERCETLADLRETCAHGVHRNLMDCEACEE